MTAGEPEQFAPGRAAGSVRRGRGRGGRIVVADDDEDRAGDVLGMACRSAVIRAFVAEAPRESALASRGREFWAARFAADRQIVQRGIDRGELPADTDPDLVIEALLGPLYLRLLVTGQPLEMAFVKRVVDLLLAGLRAGDPA